MVRRIIIAVAVLGLGACASSLGRHDFLAESYVGRPADAPVDVFVTGAPGRPFKRVARLDVHLEKTGWIPSSLQEALPELKKQARQAGCDAIVEIDERRSQVLETKVYHVTAIGVRYIDPR